MMRIHIGIQICLAIGLGLFASSFGGCERSRPQEAVPAKSRSVSSPIAKSEQESKQVEVAQAAPKSNSAEMPQKEREPEQTPAKQLPVVPSQEGQKKEESAMVPPSQEPKAGQINAVEGKEDESPGFLPNTPVERKFPFEIPTNWKRLSEQEEIWIDNQEKLVIVSGRICLTRGLLEMFACPKGMKEHESVVATYPLAMYVHQALLLIGVNPGRTVQWEPEYKPAEGPKIQVECWYYNEKNELVKQNAKEMVKLVSDGSPLKIDWVFGGSKFIVDPDGRELYAANGGELVCLSNFSSAMIDLPIPSTAEAGGLLFEANTEKIPPLDTPVLLVLKPEMPPASEKSNEGGSGK